MKGYEEILQSAGYTVKEGASLRFPEDVQEPDKEKLFVLAAELLIARVEVEQIKCAAVKRGNVSSAMPKQKPCEHLQKVRPVQCMANLLISTLSIV